VAASAAAAAAAAAADTAWMNRSPNGTDTGRFPRHDINTSTTATNHTNDNSTAVSQFVVVSLQRQSLQVSWGIALSRMDHGMVLVGDCCAPVGIMVRVVASTPVTSSTVAVSSSCVPHHNHIIPSSREGWLGRLVVEESSSSFSASAHILTQRVLAAAAVGSAKGNGGCATTSRLEQQNQKQVLLVPGDLLLAVNGNKCSRIGLIGSPFSSLVHLTEYLRSCYNVTFLVFRYQPACEAAGRRRHELLAVVQHKQRQNTVQRKYFNSSAYEAAIAANRILRPLIQQKHLVPAFSLQRTSQTSTGNSSSSRSRSRSTTTTTTPYQSTFIVPTATTTARYTNPLFMDANGNPLPYDDDDNKDDEWLLLLDYFSEYDNNNDNSRLFLNQQCRDDFPTWLQTRKQKWRLEQYRVYAIIEDQQQKWGVEEEQKLENKKRKNQDYLERIESSVAMNFWSPRGLDSFQDWLRVSTVRWKQNYSWNQKKRQRLVQDWEEIVQLDTSSSSSCNWNEWLRVRKNKWRVMRRKRQRQRLEEQAALWQQPCDENQGHENDSSSPRSATSPVSPPRPAVKIKALESSPSSSQPELLMIDALLEAQENERLARQASIAPVDIVAIFDASMGCPDDAVAHCLFFLPATEHGKLLCISSKTRKALMMRETMWRQLCPTRWKLPRRPRKPWHELYLSHLRAETEQSRKQWDDLLLKVSTLLLKGDHLQSIEKLVNEAERDYKFHVNYASGVVCERNSLLNLAVIHSRHKVTRWLVEVKHADIESCDRGSFTPLLNAAWAGDRYLVRFLMQKGAKRAKVGTCHYTKPLAPPDFMGLTSEGWAQQRGHHEIAKLIRLGL
jgi:hypothetical protein